MRILSIFFLVSLCVASSLFSQSAKKTIRLDWVDSNPNQKKYQLSDKPTDSLSAVKFAQKLVLEMQSDGYLLASLDSFYSQKPSGWISLLFAGEQFEWARLSRGNLEKEILEKSGYREQFYQNKTLKISSWQKLSNNILNYFENNGYPFSILKLDSIRQNENQISASISHQKGPLILFDTLIIRGEATIRKDFLTKYIGWETGKPYSEQTARNAIKKLKSMTYLKSISEAKILFRQDKAFLSLELESAKSTQIDGILGVLLNENPITQERKPVITGRADIRLQNPFGRGKLIELQFQRIKIASQKFDIAYTHPNLLNTNLDVKVNLKYLKEDSLFINLNRILELTYRAGKSGNFSFLADVSDSRLTTSFAKNAPSELQNYTASEFSAYGIGWEWENTDNFLLPKKGWKLNLRLKIGNKDLKPSLTTDEPNYEEIYGDVALKSTQFVSEFTLSKFWQTGENTSLLTQLNSGKVFNENLFQNDLFRIGGLTSLRGFNENFFFVSAYSILTLEQRFFLSDESYFLLFYNQAYLESEVENFGFTDFPLGFGTGFSFRTQAGIFTFVYSLGKSENQPIDFRLSKIHFGLKSLF
jgi:translocation and assembly module TamA